MRDLSDPISRQQTITALRALSDEYGYINVPHEVVTDVVRGLPPVRAEHEQTTQSERGEGDKLTSKMGQTWADVTCPNCGCEIHVESEQPEMIREIRKWINSSNRGNADYFIVDKIEEIINKYERGYNKPTGGI